MAFAADVRVNGAFGASFLATIGPEIAVMLGSDARGSPSPSDASGSRLWASG